MLKEMKEAVKFCELCPRDERLDKNLFTGSGQVLFILDESDFETESLEAKANAIHPNSSITFTIRCKGTDTSKSIHTCSIYTRWLLQCFQFVWLSEGAIKQLNLSEEIKLGELKRIRQNTFFAGGSLPTTKAKIIEAKNSIDLMLKEPNIKPRFPNNE